MQRFCLNLILAMQIEELFFLVFDDELQALVVALQTGTLGFGVPHRRLQVLQVQGLRYLLLHVLDLL